MAKLGIGRGPDSVLLPFFSHQVIEYLASLYLLQVGATMGGKVAVPCYVLGALMLAAATFSGKPLGGGRLPRSMHRFVDLRSEEHTCELQSPCNLVCRLLLDANTRSICNSSCSASS